MELSILQKPSGGPVANALVMQVGDMTLLYSYLTLVAVRMPGKKFVTSKWDYSKTTVGHVNKFFATSSDQLRRDVECGHIKQAVGVEFNVRLEVIT